MMFFGLTAKAQTTITFDTEDYKSVGVYDKWEESPFRTGELEGNAGIALNPSTTPDEVLGVAPNTTEKVVAFQRSRYGSNVYGVRIDLKEPIRVTKQLQYVHVMTYLKDKPTASRMMVIGLGRRLEASWSGQAGQDVEQFWSYTTTNVEPKDGWQDIVVSFKGFSYSKEENENSGIDLHALVIVPDVRTPDEDAADWVAYFDEIVVDGNPDKRFSTEQYALTYDKEAAMNRTDRALNKVGLTVGDKTYESAARSQKFYSNNTTTSVFSAKAGDQVQPTFGYSGNWMSGYVYVDWGNDALFKDALNANGTPAEGSDVVSYNAVQIGETWYKSDGTTRGDGNAIAQGVPTFTVPAGTASGFYRMRYKVDWNSINPAGATDIIANGGGIVDLMLDVHGDKVTVNASQLNGDIYAADGTDLISYVAGYEQPLKVKVVPAPGFVQYGFTLKYGYDVSAKEQLDDKGNPNWIEVNVPYTEIAGDGTYTIPAEYMRGSQVSITGDMQQEQLYTVEVVGLEGQGGVVYANIETLHEGTVYATQFFTVEQVEAIAVEGYVGEATLDGRVITVTYRLNAGTCDPITALSELKNYKLYHIKNENDEGYLAWNTNITDTYLSIRGVTNFGSGEPNADVRAQYAEEVSPFDETVVWQIISEDGKYYLYQPARKAYVARDGRDYKFSETKTALDAIRDNGDGTFGFHAGGGYSDGSQSFACIVTNENEMAVRNWTWSDHGSVMQIIENPNVYTLEYTVEVVGGNAGGGIIMDGNDYLHGAKVMATEFLTAADVTAKTLFLSEGEVTVDKDNAKISVAYSGPVLNADSYYTLECMATDHGRFIEDDGTSVNGRSTKGSYFMFEPGTAAGTYYIKSVVSGKYINANDNAVTVDEEKKTAWVLDVPGHTAGVATFEDGTTDNFLNNNYTAGAPYLKANYHKDGPGSGNACSLWKLTEYKDVEEVMAQWKASTLPYLGYVGGYPANLRDEIETVATIADKEAFEATYDVIAIDAATYYRLVCVSPKAGNNGDASYNTLTFDGQGNLVTRQTAATDWNQLFRFEDAGEGKYYLRNINANAYLNKIGRGDYRSAVVAKDAACKVEVLPYEGTVIQWKLHNGESSDSRDCLFAENHPGETVPYACSGWDGGANSASAWYVVPVTDFAHTLTVGDVKWASLMLGFEAAIPAEVTAYVVSSVEDGYAQLTEMEGVLPANTAVLINAEASDYEFAYSAATPATVAANELKGTLYDKNVEGAAYALGVKNSVVALYTVNLDQAEGTAFINYAYKAYLPKNTAAASISLHIEGATGIEPSTLNSQPSTQIYDLMGRRVAKMAKGVYIVNGKKVVK